MKKYHFPLDRVLAWRQTQARLAEATLAALHAELLAQRKRIAALNQSVIQARSHVLGMQSTVPIEIAALEHFRTSAVAQTERLYRESQAMEAKIAHQAQVVMERQRDAELLRRLRARRFETWQQTAEREVEQQAEESYLAQFSRSRNMQSARPMR